MSDTEKNNITVKSALKYAALPGIIPRFKELWKSGFATIAALMAQIFMNIGLLPVGHVYTTPQNFGKFGIFNVIFAAKSNLVFSKKNMDQIIVFGAISFSILLIFLQIIAFLMAIIIPGVYASGVGAIWASFFVTPTPSNDIAFVLLDRIFGVPVSTGSGNIGFFRSCVGDALTPCTPLEFDYEGNNPVADGNIPVPGPFPWAFHLALHQMFSFFSICLATVGLFLLIYFIAAVVLETAQSGTPFGKRFAKVWAPLRLITAFALIVPLSNGLNLAQYGVLYSAKWGSSFATNVWREINTLAAADGLMEPDAMIGTPFAQESLDTLALLHLAMTCKHAEEQIYPYINQTSTASGIDKEVRIYLINPRTKAALDVTVDAGPVDYAAARAFSENGDIIMRFGSLDPSQRGITGGPTNVVYGQHSAYVKPYCGEIVFPSYPITSPGTLLFQQKIYELMWGILSQGYDFFTTHMNSGYSEPNCPDTNAAITAAGGNALNGFTDTVFYGARLQASAIAYNQEYFDNNAINQGILGGYILDSIADLKVQGAVIMRDHLNCIIEAAVAADRQYIAANNLGLVNAALIDRGWAGAGIWYNRIAEFNGNLIGVTFAMPRISSWPETMQLVSSVNMSTLINPLATDLFNPNNPNNNKTKIDRRVGENIMAEMYYDIYEQWESDGPGTGARLASGNFFETIFGWIFGIEGLYSITDNTTDNVHPLARLTGLGKSLIESSIRNFTLGAGAMITDLGIGADNPMSGTGNAIGALGSALMTASGLTLTAGFILFYIVPLLPFMYFFFAVGTWVKTVFEAMVGVPLWALSHIHIEGGGLPGQKAANGYYLLFEILIRPVMIIIGFLASILVFSAMANVLMDIWEIAVRNAGGTTTAEQATFTESVRQPIDKMFYLIMFTMMLYMIGVSSFKLVDQIPQSILRWVGASIPTFVDQKDDITSTMVSRTALAANKIFGDLTQGLSGAYKSMDQSQDTAVLQKNALKRDEEVDDNTLRIRRDRFEAANQIQERAVTNELAPYAKMDDNDPNLPPEILALRQKFPEISAKVTEKYGK